MKAIVSIDFDYFVPEKAEWDISHKESMLYLDMIWRTRAHLMDVMRTKYVKGFWQELETAFTFDTDTIHVSESHCTAYTLLGDADTLILFDAHHDAWRAKFGAPIHCEDWVTHGVLNGQIKNIIWVAPSWLMDRTCLGSMMSVVSDQVGDRLKLATFADITDPDLGVTVETLHLCRSGCWVPPWLDDEFLDFAHSGPAVIVDSIGDIDALDKRWNVAAYAEVLKFKETLEVSMRMLRENV
jgi:hypothetical protein